MADPARINSRADLHAALRRLFEEAEGSYLDVATAADTGPATVHDMVNGTSFPRWTTLRRVLRALGIDEAGLDAWKQAHARARHGGEDCPYRGLDAFGPEHEKYFSGRDELTRLLWDRVSAQLEQGGPLLVTGASGAGKSSLLRAGLIPAAGRTWPDGHVVLTPSGDGVVPGRGGDPVRVLADRFRGEDAAHEARARLAEKPAVLRDLLARHGCRLLVVDQFEEIFTSCPDADDRRVFIQALHAACTSEAGPPAAAVVIGMRADFFGHCAAHPELAPALARPFVVGPMTTAQLREAVERPAALARLTIEDGLPERILEDLGAFPALPADPGDVLPLLSHTLRETWEHREGGRLTLAGYQATGGVSRSLARSADAALAGVGLADRARARRMLTRLVLLGEGSEPARRKVPAAELLGPEDDPGHDARRRILDRFVEARLVTVDSGEAGSTARFTHEALIRAWQQLRDWIEEDRDSLLVREQLARDARIWAAEGRDAAYLYRGLRLAGALDAVAGDPGGLDDDARAFLDAGVRQDAAERDSARRRVRNRTVLSAVLTILLVIAAVTAGTVLAQGRTIAAQRDEAVGTRVANLATTLRQVNPALAKQLAIVAGTLSPDSLEARGALATVHNQRELDIYRPPGVDGSWVVDADRYGHLLVYGKHHVVKLVDADARKVINEFRVDGSTIETLKVSADGRTVAVFDDQGAARVWDTTTGTPGPVAFRWASGPVGISPGGRYIINAVTRPPSEVPEPEPRGLTVELGVSSVGVDVSDTRTGELVLRIPDTVADPMIAPGDTYLVGRVGDSVRSWDLRTGRRVTLAEKLGGGRGTAAADGPVWTGLALSPDGQYLAIRHGDRLGSIMFDGRKHDVYWWPPLRNLPAGSGMRLSSDGRLLAVGGTIWPGHGSSHPVLAGLDDACGRKRGPARLQVFGPGDRTLRCVDTSGAVNVISLEEISGLLDLGGMHVVLSKDGSTAVAESARELLVWDVPGRAKRGTLPIRRGPGSDSLWLALSDDGALLADARRNGRIEIWDVASASRKVTLTTRARLDFNLFPHGGAMAFSPDGRTLALLTGSNPSVFGRLAAGPSVLELWDVPSGTLRATSRGIADSAFAIFTQSGGPKILFSPDGRTVVSAADQGIVDVATGKRLVEPPGLLLKAPKALSRTGLLAELEDLTITIWDGATLRPRYDVRLGGETGEEMAFSPDGRLLATADTTGAVRLWDVESRRPFGLPLGGTGGETLTSVRALGFTPDGSAVLSVTLSGDLRTHLIGAARIMRILCAEVGPLGPADWERYIPDLPYRRTC